MASHLTAAADWQSKILKKEYQNWLAVGHALSLMCDGLRPYVEREMKAFHQALLANLATVPPCTCPRPPKHACTWAVQLTRCHRGGKPNSPKWHQSDSSKWTDPNLGPWEVAKLFMSDLNIGKAAVVDASSTDCTGLTNLMSWCIYFRVQVHLVDAVRETRNTKWGHAARQELTDGEKADALTAIRNLLQDPELVADKDATSALGEIDKMERDFDARSVERKVQADFQVAVGIKLRAIEGEMRTTKKDLNCASSKAQKKLVSLENHQRKVLKVLENSSCTNKKLVSLENQKKRKVQHILEVLESAASKLKGKREARSSIGKALSFAWWTLTGFKTRCIQSIGGLNTKYLSLWIATLILMVIVVHLNHNSFRDGCPLEDEIVPFDTKEFNFTSNLESSREGFTGREWIFHDILESLLLKTQGNHPVRGVLVVGEPGTGKSALAAQLICSRSSNAVIHNKIIGYHLCRFSDKASQDPGRFVRNMIDLIARRIPEYGLLVSSSSSILEILHRRCLRDPYECFEQGIVAPLQHLSEGYQDRFIVVDALDECTSDSGDGGTTILRFIKDTFKRLPKWIKLIATSRNDSAVLKQLNGTPKVHLSSTDARNVQDIEIFVTAKLIQDVPFLERLQVMLGLNSGKEISHLINVLLNQSEGNFLFVKEMLHFWKDHLHNDADLNKLPKTIGDIYESYFRREFGSRENFKSALSVLEVLVGAYEPMQINHVFEVIKIREALDYDYEYDFVYTLQRLSHFIRYGADNTITLFHLSFIKWLTSSENLGNPFYVSQSHSHRRLAEYYFSVVRKTPNSVDIYRLAQHLSLLEGGDRHYLKKFRNIKASYVNGTIDKDNGTLLHLAAANNNKRVLQILIMAFENIDYEDSYGFTPAFVAAMNGLSENVEFLISKGANIKHRTKPPQSPRSLLLQFQAVQQSKVTVFSNSTMLQAAAVGGHINVIRSLLKKNASFVDVNGVNLTAIQLAALNGHLDVIQLLHKSGARLDHTLLQLAAAGGHPNVVKFLLQAGVRDRCVQCNRPDRIRYQAMPLCKSSDVSENISSDDKFTILQLILCQSALHLAVGRKNSEVFQILIDQEDNTVQCIDFTGETPLHEAVKLNDILLAGLLIQKGARVSPKCISFQNLFSTFNGGMDKCAGDDVKEENCLKEVQEVQECDKDVCHCGPAPFLLAAKYGHIEIAFHLLLHGARPQVRDCHGATASQIAACNGHFEFMDWLLSRMWLDSRYCEVELVRGPSLITINVHVKNPLNTTLINRNYSFVMDHNTGIRFTLGDWTLLIVWLVTELAKGGV